MSSALAPLFNYGISKNLYAEMQPWQPAYKEFFNIIDTDSRYIDHQLWETYKLLQPRQPGGLTSGGQFFPSFSKRYIIRNFGLGDFIAIEDWRDDRYGVTHKILAQQGGALAQAVQDTYESDVANFCINSGYASGTVAGMADGVSLFNTAHPVSLQNSTQTYSNRPAIDADLSVASYQAALTALETQQRPNATTYVHNRPSKLVVNPVSQFVADQLVNQGRNANAPWERGTAEYNSNKQVASKDVTVVQWPWFTKSGATGTNNAWMLFGETRYLYFVMRQAIEIETDYDVNTRSMIWVASTRFDEGASDARGGYGSAGG